MCRACIAEFTRLLEQATSEFVEAAKRGAAAFMGAAVMGEVDRATKPEDLN